MESGITMTLDPKTVEQVATRLAAIIGTATHRDPAWISTEDAAERLALGVRTLQRLMGSRTPGTKAPFVKIGRRVLWKEDELDDWVREMDEWQVSTDGGRSGESAGGRSMGRNRKGHARPGRRPGASRSKSKRKSPTDETGSLVSFVKRLQSGK